MRDPVTTTVPTSLAGLPEVGAPPPGLAATGALASCAKAAPAGNRTARVRAAPLALASKRRSLALDALGDGHTSALVSLDMFLPLYGRPTSRCGCTDGANHLIAFGPR